MYKASVVLQYVTWAVHVFPCCFRTWLVPYCTVYPLIMSILLYCCLPLYMHLAKNANADWSWTGLAKIRLDVYI